MAVPKVDELVAMDDDKLSEVFGFKDRIADARKHLVEIQALKGKAREIAEDKIQHMLTPTIGSSELSWIVEDSKRQANPKDQLDSNNPVSVMDD